MKIAIDLTSLADHFSGIERFAANIAYRLVKYNERDRFILLFRERIFPVFHEFQEDARVDLILLKGNNKLLFSQLVLTRVLYLIKADCLLFPAFPPPLLLFRKNMVTAIHDLGCWDCPEAMTASSRLFFRTLYRKSAAADKHILTVSRFSEGRIRERLHVAPERITVVGNGISDVFLDFEFRDDRQRAVRDRYRLPDNYLLCLSTLEPRKNMRLLTEAFTELKMEGELPGYSLVLAGRKGWKMERFLEELEEEAADSILVTGFIEDRDLPCVYAGADLFVFPSVYEGFGIPPLEAMAVGTPVLSSDAASLPEILGDAAVYFKSNDLTSLKSRLLVCLKSPEASDGQRRRMKKRTALYSWSREAERVRDLCRRIAGGGDED